MCQIHSAVYVALQTMYRLLQVVMGLSLGPARARPIFRAWAQNLEKGPGSGLAQAWSFRAQPITNYKRFITKKEWIYLNKNLNLCQYLSNKNLLSTLYFYCCLRVMEWTQETDHKDMKYNPSLSQNNWFYTDKKWTFEGQKKWQGIWIL